MWTLVVLAVLGVVFLSLAPVPDPRLPGPLENLPHAAAYAVLTTLLLTAVLWRPTEDRGIPWLGAITLTLCVIIFGSAMELAQAVVGRDIEVKDTIANVVGIVTALVIWLVVWAIRGPRAGPRA